MSEDENLDNIRKKVSEWFQRKFNVAISETIRYFYYPETPIPLDIQSNSDTEYDEDYEEALLRYRTYTYNVRARISFINELNTIDLKELEGFLDDQLYCFTSDSKDQLDNWLSEVEFIGHELAKIGIKRRRFDEWINRKRVELSVNHDESNIEPYDIPLKEIWIGSPALMNKVYDHCKSWSDKSLFAELSVRLVLKSLISLPKNGKALAEIFWATFSHMSFSKNDGSLFRRAFDKGRPDPSYENKFMFLRVENPYKSR